jgi:hypothetical protein
MRNPFETAFTGRFRCGLFFRANAFYVAVPSSNSRPLELCAAARQGVPRCVGTNATMASQFGPKSNPADHVGFRANGTLTGVAEGLRLTPFGHASQTAARWSVAC